MSMFHNEYDKIAIELKQNLYFAVKLKILNLYYSLTFTIMVFLGHFWKMCIYI